jgi:hypothetical protein
MEYIVKFTKLENLEVYIDDTIYIYVIRKYKWTGKLISTFYLNGKKILISSYDVIFWIKKINLLFQDLNLKVDLQHHKKKFGFKVGSDFYEIKRNNFKNPVYELKKNEINIGDVVTDMSFFTINSLEYKIRFNTQDNDNLCCLLLVLMDLPPTMS